jgi:hypothetical protein
VHGKSLDGNHPTRRLLALLELAHVWLLERERVAKQIADIKNQSKVEGGGERGEKKKKKRAPRKFKNQSRNMTITS